MLLEIIVDPHVVSEKQLDVSYQALLYPYSDENDEDDEDAASGRVAHATQRVGDGDEESDGEYVILDQARIGFSRDVLETITDDDGRVCSLFSLSLSCV